VVPERIEREIHVDAPIEVVWEVLTDPQHVAGWFGDIAEIDLRPGGKITHAWAEDPAGHTERGAVEKVEPPRYFSYRWIRGDETEAREDNSTLVEFTLTPEGDGTRLRVVESGFSKLDRPEDEQERDAEGHRVGWEHELGELREYAERRSDGP
jgi:uncharacterized protein YndB with AHSA1/START domain